MMHILNGYTYIRKHPQLLMTLILVLVIPLGFLLSGQQFLTATKENQERLEKDRIGILHDVFSAFVLDAGIHEENIQSEVERILRKNPDISKFSVAKEEGEGLRIIASNDLSDHGTFLTSKDGMYRLAYVRPEETVIVPYSEDGIRFWQSYRRITSSDGTAFYIFTETSLAYIDTLFASRIMTAYYWLFGILIVIMLLVVRHVRLIDYAYLYRETKRANEMKDLFTNMIAHELRAPLTAIRGYASMIREEKDILSIVEKAGKIEHSTERLIHIVNDLLDVARIHSGKLSIKNESVNLQQVIQTVTENMQSNATEKGIQLICDIHTADIYIHSDEKRLYQAMTNLLSNSIKYTNTGSITVSVKEGSDRIEIRVQDTGTGISAENQKSLFTPFFRVENSDTQSTVGTGLGMWITKQLIEQMKGSIGVESIRGIGTHIVITLPR